MFVLLGRASRSFLGALPRWAKLFLSSESLWWGAQLGQRHSLGCGDRVGGLGKQPEASYVAVCLVQVEPCGMGP